VAIDREIKNRSNIAQARIARGVMTLSRRDEQTTIYRAKSAEGEDRKLLIEHPRVPGWDMLAPKANDTEMAPGFYRVVAPVKGGTATVEITTQNVRVEAIQIGGLSRQGLMAYAQNAELSEAVRKALQGVVVLQSEVERLDRQVRQASNERERIAKDQERLRENLARVPSTSDLAKRYLDQLKSQEDRLDQLRRTEDETRQNLQAAQDALADGIAKLEI
jgi:hypothetical protein